MPISPAVRIASRFTVAVGGGYAAMVGFTGLLGIALCRMGMAGSEAVLLASMLGFPLYLSIIIWGFAAISLRRVATVLGVSALLTIGTAWLLTPEIAV